MKITETLCQFIQHYLKLHWSSEQIVGHLLTGQFSFKSIYRWINSNLLKLDIVIILDRKVRDKNLKKQEVVSM
ncbi:hypothetical protein [Staphylococcus argensis]|uniref:hypothetical protein n=1 Tax=Staphylococcus argensis TaxID=1607738 RepID=UPI0036F283FC